MRPVRFVVYLLFIIVSGASWAYAPAEELAPDLVNLELPELCAAYRAPLDAAGFPRAPFETSPALAEKRRAQSASFRDYQAKYLTELPGPRVAEFTALGRRVLAGLAEPPGVLVLDHARLCAEDAVTRAENEAPRATPEVKAEMRKALEAECLEESYGRANAFANELTLGLPVANHADRRGATFAYLHEVCHVRYPAIRHTYLEEIFCDAVAARWLLKYEDGDVQGLAASVETMLLPRNPYKEILVLRARLPGLCLSSVSP